MLVYPQRNTLELMDGGQHPVKSPLRPGWKSWNTFTQNARAGMRGSAYEYELLFDGDIQTAKPQLIGLIDLAQLNYDEKFGAKAETRRTGKTPPKLPLDINFSRQAAKEWA